MCVVCMSEMCVVCMSEMCVVCMSEMCVVCIFGCDAYHLVTASEIR